MQRAGSHRPACVWPFAAVLLLASACGQTGSATTTIDEAEVEIVELTDETVASSGLEPSRSSELGSRDRCELPTGPGATNRLSIGAPAPADGDPVEDASRILLEAGYELVDSPELEDGVFGRRDGIRITVVHDATTDEIAIDAVTGCRPLRR